MKVQVVKKLFTNPEKSQTQTFRENSLTEHAIRFVLKQELKLNYY